MVTSKISFNAKSTGSGLVLCVRFDQKEIFRRELTHSFQEISYEFDDSDDERHTIEIEMSGKTPACTRIDDAGNIISDKVIIIDQFKLDDIELGQVFVDQAQYMHDFNGTRPGTTETFFGTIGCNGTVRLQFSSPVYLWLLENM